MNQEAIEELRLCHAAAKVEAALADPCTRRVNAEALQRALITHADAIVRLVEDSIADQATIARLATALRPFGRVAQILAPGHNPVLFSIPHTGSTGVAWVQLRPADFRRAATELEARSL